ncbi:MAG: NAD(P)-dependent oxidoreductase [Proteobacteria bacterium]|nr:NAD(P)-dependent oxidoreductase [Pseudomonadota bacterium]
MNKPNTRSTFATLGASNHVEHTRQKEDFYATDPKAIDILLSVEKFKRMVLEPACGMGHLSKRLKKHDYIVESMDLIDRGYGRTGIDFLKHNYTWSGDIITNPPFKHAVEFIKHSLDILPVGNKVAMFLKILFLETDGRKQLFLKYPPKVIYILANRLCCAKDGDFVKNNTKAVGYAWYVFEKGFKGDTIVKWVN